MDAKELRQKEQRLRELLGKVRQATGGGRQSDADRKRRGREAEREVRIADPEDLKRRTRLEADVLKWLKWYLPHVFFDPFQEHNKEMVAAIIKATRHGGDQALAAPRGEGKTTICEGCLIYCVLKGILFFPVLFSATGSDAEESLTTIRAHLEESDRLAADYPEVCGPIRALQSTPQRAKTMLVTGTNQQTGQPFYMAPCSFHWTGRKVIFPKVPGSRCAGAIIATRGLDAAVRGLKVGIHRPDLAVIDDPDTEETARSEDQREKLERRIDRTIAGLAGRGRRLARVMLTTLQNVVCASARYTDPQIKGSWKGKRIRFIVKFPERTDLWDEYVTTRRDAGEDDEFARKAHRFYLANRKKMDRGAKVTNPNSFDGRTLPDGSQMQVSALQRYYDFVADNGEEAALCELQNDPPEESGPIESGITARRIQRQLSGHGRRIVPPGCTLVTQGIDVRKIALHYVVRAWRPDATGFTIHYDVQEVRGTVRGSDEGVEHAIFRALEERRQSMFDDPYTMEDGTPVPIGGTLVDAGWQTDTIYAFCRAAGKGWWPAMGFGKSNGCVRVQFNMPSKDSPERKSGENWFLSYRRKPKVWLACANADHWKGWEHARWLTDPGKPGAMRLWGNSGDGSRLTDDEKRHFSYAKHLTAEIEVEEVIKGILRRHWKQVRDTNHWLDASYLSDVAANMLGISLMARVRRKPEERPSLSQLQRK